MQPRSSLITEALRIGLLLLASSLLLLAAYQLPGDIFLDFGPNDDAYVAGFRKDFEIDEPTFIHWSMERGRVRLPFILPNRAFDIAFRYKRHTRLPADIRVFVNGSRVDRFVSPQRDFAVRTISVKSNPKPWNALEIVFLAHSQDPRPLGLALDWLQVRPRGWVLPTVRSLLFLLGIVAGLYGVPRLVGFSSKASLAIGVGGTAALCLWVGFHKLAPIHAASTLGLRWHAMTLIFIAFFLSRRRNENSVFSRPEARWAFLAFYLGTTFRLMGLFHSEFYYPDVRTHSKFVSLIWTEGLVGFFSDHIAHQHQHLLGLQLVGGRWLAFPYPPLLYLTVYPLSLLRLPVDDWMKMVPAVLVGVEALIVYGIALRLGTSGRAAAAAAWFHATAPLVAFRLTVASYAALFGHFWDSVVVLYLIVFFARMNRLWAGLGLAALVALSLLSYAGSALVLGLFIPAFALTVIWRRREPGDAGRAARTALWALAGALTAVALFYIQYLPELLPGLVDTGRAAASSEGLIELRFTPIAALEMAAHRINLFFGPFYGLLIFVALARTRKRVTHNLGFPLVAGALTAFFGLNFLRSGLGNTHIFQFTKDDLVLLPLAAIVFGVLVDELAHRGRFAKWAAAAVLAAWVGWGCWALARDVRIRFVRPDYPPERSAVLLVAPRTRRACSIAGL